MQPLNVSGRPVQRDAHGASAETEVPDCSPTRPRQRVGAAPTRSLPASNAHGSRSVDAEALARAELNKIKVGDLAAQLKPELLDVVHSLAYEKDTAYDSFQGKLSPAFLLAWARGKHAVGPGERRHAWAAAPGGLDLRSYSSREVETVKGYGATFVGVTVPHLDGTESPSTGKTVFRAASDIENDLKLLCREVKQMLDLRSEGDADPMKGARVAAHFKQNFIAIHPYMDGNGRVSRLVAERILREYKLPRPDWKHQEYGLNLTVEEAARLMLAPRRPQA